MTYWLPMLEMEPVKYALLPARWQRSPAIAGESLLSGGWPMSRKSLLDALLGDQAQERRLLELRGKTLAEGVVKDGIAGFVDEVRENDGVHLGQGVGAVGVVEPASNSQESDEECSSGGYVFQPKRRAEGACWRGYGGWVLDAGEDVIWPDSETRFSCCRSERTAAAVG